MPNYPITKSPNRKYDFPLMSSSPKYERILLKLSGEALMGDLAYGTDAAEVRRIAEQVQATRARGVEVAVVVGARLGR